MHVWLRGDRFKHAVAAVLCSSVALLTLPAAARPRAHKGPVVQVPATLIIDSTTTGATVDIDGKPVGKTPIEDGIAVTPGSHTIRVHLRGWAEYNNAFTVKPGQQKELEIEMLPISGIVRIKTKRPGATVKVNGLVVGITPFDGDVSVGKAVVTITRPGYYDVMRQLSIIPGKTYDLKIALKMMPGAKLAASGKTHWYKTWWFWTAIGVVIAGGATAAAVAATSGGTTTLTPQRSLAIP